MKTRIFAGRHAILTLVILLSLVPLSHPQRIDQDVTDPASDAGSDHKVVSWGHEGLLFTFPGESEVRVHGYLQGDARMFLTDLRDRSPDRLTLRRLRPLIEGTLFRTLDFRFMPDFGEHNAVIQEAYVELRTPSVLRFRIGKFKTPLGLEALKQDRELTFVERSLVSGLLPVRDLGAQLGGSAFKDTFEYAIGYFNGATDGSNAQFEWHTGNESVARAFIHPFLVTPVRPLQHFGLGCAGSLGDDHSGLPGFKTLGQNTFFRYSSTSIADGQHTRITPQAYYYYGPVGALAEYVVSTQAVRNGVMTRDLSNQAWQITGSFALTGEHNTYAGIFPAHAFNPARGWHHLGAWEIAARHSVLHVDPHAFPLFANPAKSAQAGNESAVGLNWYLNRYAKLVVDYAHTRFAMAVLSVAPLHSENVVTTRLQLGF